MTGRDLGIAGKCGCGKIRYVTRRDAKIMAARFRSEGTVQTGTRLRVYRCDLEPYFHLTSNPTETTTFFREWRASR